MDPSLPAMAPPPGVIPNFDDPESRAWESIVTVAVCLSFMVPIFAMRMYSKAFITRALGWDDYTCALGVVFTIAFSGTFLNMINYGYGNHSWNLRFTRIVDGLKFLLTYTILYGPTMLFIKASVLLLYRKLFAPKPEMRLLIWIGIGYLLITNSVSTILFGALCAPRNGQSPLIRYSSPQCIDNVTNLALANAVTNLIADVYLLVLPLPTIWKLNMSTKRKYAIIGLFMTGFLACLASLVSVILRSKYGHNLDYSFWSPRMVITSLIEMNVGIICACIPACAAVFRQPFPDLFRMPSFTPIKSWLSSLVSIRSRSRSTSRSSNHPYDEKAENGKRPSRESNIESGLVGVNSASSFNRGIHN